MNIIADATLKGLEALIAPPFTLTTYASTEELLAKIQQQTILFCRSTLTVDATLLANTSIQWVGTASSGVDHIDIDYLKQRGIQLMDAKGSNAISVADYVTATLAYLETYQYIRGNQAGVIGLGKTGSAVAKRLHAAGYKVHYYDPAKGYKDFAFLHQCDLVCVHPNLHTTPPWPSFNLLNADFFAQLKKPLCIINTSRGGVVNEEHLLQTQSRVHYCTDVYWQEPNVNPSILDFATLCTPHIAGHSIEAKNNAVIQLVEQLYQNYKLPPPKFAQSPATLHALTEQTLLQKKNWQEWVLNLYNPNNETQCLKQAVQHLKALKSPEQWLSTAFNSLRKAHSNRHHFDYYAQI